MKVLFLDIDGVVNSRDSTVFKNSLWPLDPYKAFLIGKIQLDTGCEVVLSSSWRHHSDGVAQVEERIVKLLDKTPDLPGGIRGNEISQWLRQHPEVDTYAILDDDSDMLALQKPNFFKTTFETGLTDEIAKQVIEHLNAKA